MWRHCKGKSTRSREKLHILTRHQTQHRRLGKRKTIVIVAEGAHDQDLKRISPTMVKDLLSERLKLDTRITTLGHVQRGGSACAYDRMLSTLQGVDAVDAVLTATPDTPSPVISIVENKIVRNSLLEAVRLTNDVTAAIEAKDFDRAMSLRDNEFREYYNAFLITTATEQPELKLPPEKVNCTPTASRHTHMPPLITPPFTAHAHGHHPRWRPGRRHERCDARRRGLLPIARSHASGAA